MAETISMPKLGFDMAEGTLVRWVKNEGEAINKGELPTSALVARFGEEGARIGARSEVAGSRSIITSTGCWPR